MSCNLTNCSLPMKVGDELSSCGGTNCLVYCVDVHTLIHRTEQLPVQSLRVADFPTSWITQKCWTNMQGPNVPRPAPDLFSPQELLDDPAKSPAHWEALKECNLDFPILVAHNPDGSWNMVNGKHRFIKSKLEGREFILAKIVSVEDLEAAKWED